MATIALSGPTLVKAGVGVSAVMTADAGLEVEHFIEQAEGSINAMTRYDFVTNWIALSGPGVILTQIAEDLAAISCISYDMSGYTTRIEAESMITVLRDSALRGLSIIRDQKVVDYMKNA